MEKLPMLAMGMGMALLLLAAWDAKWHKLWKWACLFCALVLMVRPMIAFWQWLGGVLGA